MDHRRRVPRQAAGWIGSCQIDGEPADEKIPCVVLDISELGIGILVGHPRGLEMVGRHIAVVSPTVGASVHMRLEGEVKNAVPAGQDSVRLGIEFDGLTPLEQTVANALGLLSAAR